MSTSVLREITPFRTLMTSFPLFSMGEYIVFALRKYYFLIQNILFSPLENEVFSHRKQNVVMCFR